LCVVWQDTQLIAKHNPDLLEKFAVLGINIMLYNLALNPHIKKIVVWGPDKLSNTPIGIAGRQALLELWQAKKKTDTIVKEIEPNALDTIFKNVDIVDLSAEAKPDFSVYKGDSEKPYSDPIIFPEFKVEAPDTLPSERYIYPIREQKGADAYLTLLHTVWKYGTKTKIDENSEDVKEIRGATVVIEKENPEDFYLPDWLTQAEAFGITKHSLEEYYKSQFSAEPYRKEIFPGVYMFDRPRDYAYLYAELMYAFPRQEMTDDSVHSIFKEEGYEAAKKFLLLHSTLEKKKAETLIKAVEKKIKKPDERIRILLEGLIPTIDQIAYVIDRIKRKPYDLDKEVVLWDQRYHTQMESGRPCLFKFSFTVRNDQVDIHVFVRSHDIGRAWFFNFYGINQLLGRIAKETGYKPGLITIESQSAHIYQRDWKNVDEFLKKQVVDKIPRMFFDPERDSDPRGVVQVSVVGNMIKAKLLDTGTGKQLFELEGRSARELLYKLKHFNFISRVDHAAFIGSELAKAEICMKMGIEYKYDNPIILPNNEKILS
jgi:thymidylate synthase